MLLRANSLPGLRLLVSFCSPLLLASIAFAQTKLSEAQPFKEGPVNVNINVRNARGFPIDTPATVHFYSAFKSFDIRTTTADGGIASLRTILPGEYVVEVSCPTFRTATETITVLGWGADYSTYIYLQPEGETFVAGIPKSVAMSARLQGIIDKGLDAMRKKNFEVARAQFTKATQLSPSNPDAIYLLGSSEVGLQNTDAARQDFKRVLTIEPGHEKALLCLGELELRAGNTDTAINVLEKEYTLNGAGWRVRLMLATAYAKAGKLPEAESNASRAAALAGEKGAGAALLLAEVQYAEGKRIDAKRTYQDVVTKFPKDPAAETARQKLLASSWENVAAPAPSQDFPIALPAAAIPAATLLPITERPWAPPDIDEKEYPVATNASCNMAEVLASASHRMKTQLRNFEKFTATETIDHQEIDRFGRPGAPQTRDFAYIVFVHPMKGDSVYLEEDRNGNANNVAAFPTSLATTGLNSLGVSVLQPMNRDSFVYQCQGLASIRGQAAWQIRFEEKPASSSGVRRWQRNGAVYDLPIKGRIWLASTNFDVLRIETDLEAPDRKLDLMRDHLTVDYGPITFTSTNTTLWLPWSAEMFMELHGRRYHHKHTLTNYMLFAVDSSNKIQKPAEPPPPQSEDPTIGELR